MRLFKKHFLFANLLIGMICSVALCACDKDDEPEYSDPDGNGGSVVAPGTPVADPPHTVTVNLLYNQDYRSSTSLGNSMYIYVDGAYNLCGDGCELVDIGKVSGLGNIVTIPDDGWKSKTAAIVGHGYILRGSGWAQGTYARLYIVEEMVATTGGVMGYTVKYQCPMETNIVLSSKSVTLDSEGTEKEITLTSGANIQVKSQPNWLTVNIDYPKILLSAGANLSSRQRTGTVVLYNASGESEITVTQSGGDDVFGGGSGTEDDPYIVSTAKHLDNIRLVAADNLYFKQTADIDLSGYIDPNGNGWEPIMDFTGTYDGNFHEINGIWINRPTTNDVGLFGSAHEATFKGIILQSDHGIYGNDYVAGICGHASNSKTLVYQCSVYALIMAQNRVCGIVCEGAASQCRIFTYLISLNSTAYGICSGDYAENCYVNGDVSSKDYCYAFCYHHAENCYIIGGNDYDYLSRYNTIHCYGPKNTSDADMRKKSTYEGWDFNNVWSIKEGFDYPQLRCFENARYQF